MPSSKTFIATFLAGGLLLAATSLGGQDAQVEQGRCLLEDVGNGGDCHTSRGEGGGKPAKTKWLKGATLDFQPVTPIEKWRKTSPDITPGGWLGNRWGEDGLKTYLHTGVTPIGGHSDPPMPLYKFSEKDAVAVGAYLKPLQ